MHIINLTPLEPGVYNDHASDSISAPPEGWAYIPEDFPLPSTFPRLGNIEAEELTYIRDENGSLIPITQSETGEVPNGVTIMTVTSMTAGTVPEPEPVPEAPPTNEELAAENKLLREQVAALSDQNDFQEELIVELANIVYA